VALPLPPPLLEPLELGCRSERLLEPDLALASGKPSKMRFLAQSCASADRNRCIRDNESPAIVTNDRAAGYLTDSPALGRRAAQRTTKPKP